MIGWRNASIKVEQNAKDRQNPASDLCKNVMAKHCKPQSVTENLTPLDKGCAGAEPEVLNILDLASAFAEELHCSNLTFLFPCSFSHNGLSV